MTGKARLGYRPSKKSIERMVERVHALTDRAGSWHDVRAEAIHSGTFTGTFGLCA
jgi:hypothetical protein